MRNHQIPKDHPRYLSLTIRESIINGMHNKVVAEAGLIAHGRGEAFDYILGEETPPFALKQERLAVLNLLEAKHPIISVNGNVAALCPNDIVRFSKIVNAPLEINLFYRSKEREDAIKEVLLKAGADHLLGIDPDYQEIIKELSHSRRIVDSRGIASSDCVFVPLEDGDRTLALRKLGKSVITIDLNPLSRTSLAASVTITNNIIRAVPEMIKFVEEYRACSHDSITNQLMKLNNKALLQESLKFMADRLILLSREEKLFNLS
ncbi:phosphopantothenate/pantothenate synthetase [Candidatus Hodarchaeum mangrovi]